VLAKQEIMIAGMFALEMPTPPKSRKLDADLCCEYAEHSPQIMWEMSQSPLTMNSKEPSLYLNTKHTH